MSKRIIENLEDAPASAQGPIGAEEKAESLTVAPRMPAVLIDVHYPDPTPLAVVVRDVAKWSGLCFVMQSTNRVVLQIFSPYKQPPDKAYELFLAALSIAGLRTVQVGQVVKIVPPSLPLGA